MIKQLFGTILAVAALSASAEGKSTDDCREESAGLPQAQQQQAVIDCLIASASPSKPEPPPPTAKKPRIGTPTAAQVARVKAAMRNKLRDPFSAVLSSMTTREYARDPSLTICGLVNAKNAFGAYIGNRPFGYQEGLGRLGPAFWVGDGDSSDDVMISAVCSLR